MVRARGYIAGARYNGSEWFLESMAVGPPAVSAFELVTNVFRFSFFGIAGVRYDVEYKESLSDDTWIQLEQRIGFGQFETVTDAMTAEPMRFYRIRAVSQ